METDVFILYYQAAHILHVLQRDVGFKWFDTLTVD